MSQPKINFNNLTHHFLVATPQMPDPRFDRAVIYVCRHDKQGMLGLVINEPFEHTTVSRLFEDLDIELKRNGSGDELALAGGPVHPEVGFILHTGQPTWISSFPISENVSITTSRDILQSIAIDSSVTNFLMCLGHVGWGKKQILNEIQQGDWLVVPADLNILFNAPFDERWQLAGEKIGVKMDYLSTEVGNA